MSEYVDTRAILKREYEFWENTVLKGVRADNKRSVLEKENRLIISNCAKCGKRIANGGQILCYACYMSPENKSERIYNSGKGNKKK